MQNRIPWFLTSHLPHQMIFGHPFEEEKDLEKISEPLHSIPEEPLPEYTDGPVKSFDDLISKYHIDTCNSNGEER